MTVNITMCVFYFLLPRYRYLLRTCKQSIKVTISVTKTNANLGSGCLVRLSRFIELALNQMVDRSGSYLLIRGPSNFIDNLQGLSIGLW